MPGNAFEVAGGGPVGTKGTVKNPITLTLMCLCTPYFLYWYYFQMLPEMKTYLGKSDQEINPMKELIFAVLCFVFAALGMLKLGKLIQEAQARAGRPNPPDQGTKFLICTLFCFPAAVYFIQTELNRTWDTSLP